MVRVLLKLLFSERGGEKCKKIKKKKKKEVCLIALYNLKHSIHNKNCKMIWHLVA